MRALPSAGGPPCSLGPAAASRGAQEYISCTPNGSELGAPPPPPYTNGSSTSTELWPPSYRPPPPPIPRANASEIDAGIPPEQSARIQQQEAQLETRQFRRPESHGAYPSKAPPSSNSNLEAKAPPPPPPVELWTDFHHPASLPPGPPPPQSFGGLVDPWNRRSTPGTPSEVSYSDPANIYSERMNAPRHQLLGVDRVDPWSHNDMASRSGMTTPATNQRMPTPDGLPCVGEWLEVSPPVHRSAGPSTWRGMPQLSSKHEWNRVMKGPSLRFMNAVGGSRGQYLTCRICQNSRGFEENVPGPQHYGETWQRMGEAVCDRNTWWHIEHVPEFGGSVRFNYLDGAIEMCRGPAPPSDEIQSLYSSQQAGHPQLRLPPAVPYTLAAQETALPNSRPRLGRATGQGFGDPDVGVGSEAAVLDMRYPWLVEQANVEGHFFGEWYQGMVRRVFYDEAFNIQAEVRWDGESSMSILGVRDLRQITARLDYAGALQSGAGGAVPKVAPPPPPAAAPPAAPPPPSGSAPFDQRSPPYAADAGYIATPVAQTQQVVQSQASDGETLYREMEAITPSDNFFSVNSVQHYGWICHMCKKKFSDHTSLPDHLVTRTHQRKRQLGYRFEDWVSYNMGAGFYDAPEMQTPAQPVGFTMPVQAMPAQHRQPQVPQVYPERPMPPPPLPPVAQAQPFAHQQQREPSPPPLFPPWSRQGAAASLSQDISSPELHDV